MKNVLNWFKSDLIPISMLLSNVVMGVGLYYVFHINAADSMPTNISTTFILIGIAVFLLALRMKINNFHHEQ